jgi:Fe-S cluster assembly scaffold protein SufB
VPPEIAEQLIVLGFFDEVIAKLPAPAIRAELRAAVATKLLAHRPGNAVREEVSA